MMPGREYYNSVVVAQCLLEEYGDMMIDPSQPFVFDGH
jgi:hypothetical protein